MKRYQLILLGQMKFSVRGQNLKTLVGIDFPDGITDFDCSHNQLTNLQGCPNSATKLYCSNNLLTSLYGCSNSVTQLLCFNNSLTSLQGCPNSVTELDCFDNSLTSLHGCSNSVTSLECGGNQLTSLRDCPQSVTGLDCNPNPLREEYKNKTLEQIHQMNKIKAYKRGIKQLNRLLATIKIQKNWKRYWYDKVDKQGINRFCKYALQCDINNGLVK